MSKHMDQVMGEKDGKGLEKMATEMEKLMSGAATEGGMEKMFSNIEQMMGTQEGQNLDKMM